MDDNLEESPDNREGQSGEEIPTPLPLLVVLLGPTASGKTALSLHLAERFSGEIVSCDSVAVYREMEIGTAKPSLAERRRIPHHLIDVADLSEAFTAGDYSRLARAALSEITTRKKLPIVTGGTGLYLRALIDGLFPAPQRSEEIRARLRRAEAAKGATWLHRILTRLDPEAAQQIHANDLPKLVRAIEVCLTARPADDSGMASRARRAPGISHPPHRTESRAQSPLRPHQPARGSHVRAWIRRRDSRARGEIRSRRPATHLARLQTGARIPKGEMKLQEAVASAQQGHRNYAKRQMTWFRREPEVHWLNGFGDEATVRDESEQIIASSIEPTTLEH